jgi:hypothetical protein
MDVNYSLFERLLHAELEDEVEKALAAAGFGIDNYEVWKPLGGMGNNISTVGNQKEDPTDAMVEKLINSIDAVLLGECHRSNVDPEGPEAPQSMADAAEAFFGIPGGRMENLTPGEQTALADKIHLVAVGEKSSPNYLIIDKGEGQTPATFPETFLSLVRENKMRIHFVQGKFNSGGTAVLPFCGEKNMQLIVSRRSPASPVKTEDETRHLWGFTIVRRLKPTGGRRSSMYVYLAPTGRVLSFEADAIKVLPEKRTSLPPRAYAGDLEYGTCIKLYNYRWKAKSIATTEARYELERFLHLPILPFRLTETRDYKANYFSTTISGVWVSVSASAGDESSKVEQGFHEAWGELDLVHIGKLPYRMVVFKEDIDPRHIPHGVFFTINGQVHGGLPSDFVSRHLKFDYLRDHLLVSVDCTKMDDAVREDFFMSSRDRTRKNEAHATLVERLREALRDHPGLRELNAVRRQRAIEKAVSNEEEATKVFNDLVKADPALAQLFGLGDRISTGAGPGPMKPYKGRRYPTFFRLPKDGIVKRVPLNRTTRLEFETDVVNDYFRRSDSPGSLTTDPRNIIEHSRLWNGRFTAFFRVPWNAEVGNSFKVGITVDDVQTDAKQRPFESEFTLVAEKDEDDRPPKPPPKPNPPETPANGPRSAPRLAMPEIHETNAAPERALEVRHRPEGGYEFFVNVDNAHLTSELKRTRQEEHLLIRYWFKYGLALCALGMLQDSRVAAKGNSNGSGKAASVATQDDDSVVDELEVISKVTQGLARVIVPVIRALYKGPTRALLDNS